MLSALLLTLLGLTNVAIPLAAVCGALCFQLVKFSHTAERKDAQGERHE